MFRVAYGLSGLSAAVLIAAVAPGAVAQTAAQARAAADLPTLDLSTSPSAVAAKAAQAVRSAPAAPAAGDAVAPVTVRPEAQNQGRVVASTDAAPLSSPDFTAADAASGPLAVGIGQNTAAGEQKVDNRPPPGGLLRANPDLLGGPTRNDLGVTTVF